MRGADWTASNGTWSRLFRRPCSNEFRRVLSILFLNTRNRWLAPSLPMGHLSALQVLRGAAGHLSCFRSALYFIDLMGVETSPLPSRFWKTRYRASSSSTPLLGKNQSCSRYHKEGERVAFVTVMTTQSSSIWLNHSYRRSQGRPLAWDLAHSVVSDLPHVHVRRTISQVDAGNLANDHCRRCLRLVCDGRHGAQRVNNA